MLIESLSVPKVRDLSQSGDDVLVVVPQRLYAVFDGATDPIGTPVDGSTPGRFAASQAARAMVQCATGPQRGKLSAAQWMEAMNQAIAQGLADAGAAGVRASSTAAIAEDAGDSWRFLIVGDSGIRLNGTELHHYTKDVDLLYAAGRLAIRRRLQALGHAGDALEASTRKLVFSGLGQPGQSLLSPTDVQGVLAQAVQDCTGRLQADAIGLVPQMLMAGIGGAQARYSNLAGHSLGYGSLDGGTTLGPDVVAFTRPKSEVHSIELFTDGYVGIPAGTRVRDWEAEFERVEQEDFHKTTAHPGVKGSSAVYFTDDRTVLTLHLPH